jgi:hypothetical protein
LGILGKLLTLPLMGPIEGVAWIAEKLVEQADKELYNEDRIRSQLMELELKLDLDEISEEEYMEAEELLLARLKVVRERQAAARQG